MALIFNVKRALVDDKGEVQRVKFKDSPVVSLGYGLYLGDSSNDKGAYKTYFLMSSFNATTGNVVNPTEIKNGSRFNSLSYEECPYSKKFTTAEVIIHGLTVGKEYWFAYTSDATSSVIDNRQITYESLDLICVSDIIGVNGITALLQDLFRLHKLPPQPN
jgi:hypothetical protein